MDKSFQVWQSRLLLQVSSLAVLQAIILLNNKQERNGGLGGTVQINQERKERIWGQFFVSTSRYRSSYSG